MDNLDNLSSFEINTMVDETEKKIKVEMECLETVSDKMSNLRKSIITKGIELDNLNIERIDLQKVISKCKENLKLLDMQHQRLKTKYFIVSRQGR